MLKINNPKLILIFIILFTLFFRLNRIDYPNTYVFDEVYHAFTAKEYLSNNPDAWVWWSTPPKGVAFEWTHPPLAKEIMALSMFIFQSTDPWAWRIPGVIFGTLSVFLVYRLALLLFKKESIGLLSAFIFSVDGLNFVQSRTGMNDIYYVTLILASLYLFLRNKFFFSSVLFGLAISSKWAAIYLLGIFLILIFKQKIFSKVVYFILIPPIIYLLSYTPFFLLGFSSDQFIHLQQQMWWYHTGLKATHAYSSPWWSWPLNFYPVWYFVEYPNNQIANIFASGNPTVFWAGSIAIIFTTWDFFKKKSINLFIVLLAFFAFWLPWSFSPRIMFLYHFSPCVPFLCIALGYQLGEAFKTKANKLLIASILFILLISFLLLYPFLTGIALPKELVNIFFYTNAAENPF